jgi:hypothetical protein
LPNFYTSLLISSFLGLTVFLSSLFSCILSLLFPLNLKKYTLINSVSKKIQYSFQAYVFYSNCTRIVTQKKKCESLPVLFISICVNLIQCFTYVLLIFQFIPHPNENINIPSDFLSQISSFIHFHILHHFPYVAL